MSNALTTYETDLHAWAEQRASLLRAWRLHEADVDNIAEEISALGRSERRELTSCLAVLLTHLLKWQRQPDLRGRSWQLNIAEQRRRLDRHLAENPACPHGSPSSSTMPTAAQLLDADFLPD